MAVRFQKRISVAAVLFLLMGMAIAGQALSGETSKGAKNAPLLRVLKKCPLTEPTCVVFDIYLSWNGGRALELKRHPKVVSVTFDDTTGWGVAVVNVRGRLNGGPEKEYHIVFHAFDAAMRCQDLFGPVVGVSGKTGGTILTDVGRLEVTGETLTFGSRNSLQLIKSKTLSITGHLSSGWESGSWKEKPIISAEGRVMWEVQGQCLDYESGKLFQIVPKGECRGNKLVRATKAEIERVRKGGVYKKTYANERLKYDLWRLMDAPFLANIWGVACT